MNIMIFIFMYIILFLCYYYKCFFVTNDRLCCTVGEMTIEAFFTKFLSQCLYVSIGRKVTCEHE